MLNPQNYGIYTSGNVIYTKDINYNNYENQYYIPLINLMKDHIDDKNLMTMKFKVVFEDDEYAFLNTIDLFINLTLWNIPILANLSLTSEYFVFSDTINNNIIAEFIDNIISKLIDKIDRKFINNIIADTIVKFNIINEFSFFICNTISLFDIIELSERSEEIKQILNTDLSDSNFVNIKDESDKLANMFFENIKKDKKSSLYDYVSSGEGFSLKQFKECLTTIGIKPDGLGGIFQTPVYNSFLDGGCNNPLYYRIDASTARTSQIIIESNVGKSGDFSNRLSYNNLDTLLHPDPEYVCDTKNFNIVTIENEKDLKLFNNRYYRFPNSKVEYCITENDTFLIGKTIEMRTPMKCASYARGSGVCYRCYGKLANINRGLNIGKIASDLLSSSCTQPQLSSKHILEVKLFKYVWNDMFNKYLDIEDYFISVKPTTNLEAKLIIDRNDIEYSRIDDDDEDDDDKSEIVKVSKVSLMDENNEVINIMPSNMSNLIILNPLLDILEDYICVDEETDDEMIIIPLSNIENQIILSIPILNDDLINIIENAKKYIYNKSDIEAVFLNGGDLSTISTLFRNSVINDARLNINPLHLEVIMAAQIYEDKTCSKRPNWSLINPKYTMVDLRYSLKNNPSVIISLINGHLSFVLSKPSTFIKEKSSIFDPLYTECITDYYNKNI